MVRKKVSMRLILKKKSALVDPQSLETSSKGSNRYWMKLALAETVS